MFDIITIDPQKLDALKLQYKNGDINICHHRYHVVSNRRTVKKESSILF